MSLAVGLPDPVEVRSYALEGGCGRSMAVPASGTRRRKAGCHQRDGIDAPGTKGQETFRKIESIYFGNGCTSIFSSANGWRFPPGDSQGVGAEEEMTADGRRRCPCLSLVPLALPFRSKERTADPQ